MVKLTVKLMAGLLIFIAAGCGEPDPADPGVEAAPEAEETVEISELSDEAAIDIMAHQMYLTEKIAEEYEDDPMAYSQKLHEELEKVANSHGITFEDLQAAQWDEQLQDPDYIQKVMDRVEELKE